MRVTWCRCTIDAHMQCPHCSQNAETMINTVTGLLMPASAQLAALHICLHPREGQLSGRGSAARYALQDYLPLSEQPNHAAYAEVYILTDNQRQYRDPQGVPACCHWHPPQYCGCGQHCMSSISGTSVGCEPTTLRMYSTAYQIRFPANGHSKPRWTCS